MEQQTIMNIQRQQNSLTNKARSIANPKHPWRFVIFAAALSLAQFSASGQLLYLDMGAVELQPNQGGQVHDFYIQNLDSTPLGNIQGLNFYMQVGDGSSGPRVESLSLYDGNSIFSSFSENQANQGSTYWKIFYGIDSTSLTLPALSSTLLARVTFDTTGIGSGSGPWTISPSVDFEGTQYNTEYVLSGGTMFREIDMVNAGTLTVVPEPSAYGIVAGVMLIGAGGIRQWQKRTLKPAAH
jgi:hypothetical protein